MIDFIQHVAIGALVVWFVWVPLTALNRELWKEFWRGGGSL